MYAWTCRLDWVCEVWLMTASCARHFLSAYETLQVDIIHYTYSSDVMSSRCHTTRSVTVSWQCPVDRSKDSWCRKKVQTVAMTASLTLAVKVKRTFLSFTQQKPPTFGRLVFSNCAIHFVHVALFVVHIRSWTVCSHFILGRTFLRFM